MTAPRSWATALVDRVVDWNNERESKTRARFSAPLTVDKPSRTWPHCDQRVLHAPGECDTCDEHARDLQDVRFAWGINFTGQHDPTKYLCPAEYRRSLGAINRWGGNTPNGPIVPAIPQEEEIRGMRKGLERLFSLVTGDGDLS